MSGRAAGAAIAGLGMTSLGRVYGLTPRRLAATAIRLAAADAGIPISDIDGLLICPGISGGLDLGLAGHLGMRDLALAAVVSSLGASAVTAVQMASLAVTSGSAKAVACVFADTPLREGAPAGSAFGTGSAPHPGSGRPERHGFGGLAVGYGFRSVTVYYALAARRHMERYGTTSEQLGAVAIAQRQWAAGNPLAQYRDPISIADHQRSRWVAEPLHLLDCSLVSNGAIAVIVTSAAAAARGPRPPVHVWGWGQGHPGHEMAAGSDFGLVTGAVQASRSAMDMAGVGPGDVTMCQLYDCYTHTVLVTLEDYGFCEKGEGGPFAASGALAPGGSLPVNTGGGQLSAYYMWGFTPLSEAVIQARGDGGDRQSPATDVILVGGNGGLLAHHGTLVVSPHPPPRKPRPTAARKRRNTVADRAGAVQHEAVAHEVELPGADSAGIVKADARSAPFFAAAAKDELLIKRCNGCDSWQGPSASHCPGCGDSADLSWAAASGAATLVSWSVVPTRDGGPVAIPAFVELAEGPWLSTALRPPDAAGLAALHAGQPLTAEFVHPPDGESYPVFRPTPQQPASRAVRA